MILETKNLSKSFGTRKAVNNLSLEISEGSVFGFLGPNGSGKSTTIRMMTALISPDGGEVFIQGNSVQKMKNRALQDVGALIEKPDFYKHLSGETNLKMLARMDGIDEKRIKLVLEKTGMKNRRNDKVKTYSQGMKQRLGIAQALLSHPKLLILDEPTNGLDPQGMKEIRDLICELSDEGITIFISSHLLDEVQKICSHAAIISLGKLITSGTINTLLSNSEYVKTEVDVSQPQKASELLLQQDWVQSCNMIDAKLLVNLKRKNTAKLVEFLIQNSFKIYAVIPRTSLEDLFLSKVGTESVI